MASRSIKTSIIETLFNERWNPETNTLSNPTVTYDDIRRFVNKGNVYAFFKDIVRNTSRANEIWPVSVLNRGYTGIQAVAESACFTFVPLPQGQLTAFVTADVLSPNPSILRHEIESASLPFASRQLGRGDEPWLIQVAVRLRLIETHLALFSPRQIITVDHLQMSVKLQPAEIDALFLAVEQISGTQRREIIITCEAKSLRDDIIEEQVRRQVKTLGRVKSINQEYILPIAIKAIKPSEIYLVEFDVVPKEEAERVETLVVVKEVIYILKPSVPGIGE